MAVEMLKVGIDSERSALGLNAATTSICDGESGGEGLREAVEAAMAIMERHTRANRRCSADMGVVTDDGHN